MCQKKILAVYLKKLPSDQYPSSGQGWSESPEGRNNLPWRLARGRERTTEGGKIEKKCGKGEVVEGDEEGKERME